MPKNPSSHEEAVIIDVKVHEEEMPTHPMEVNGTTQKKEGAGLKAVLLRGKPGSGKTRFYLKDLWRAVGQAYKQLTEKKLDWNQYHKWTPEIRNDVREAAKHCMMCVIDMDYQGLDDLVARDSIVPPEIAGSIYSLAVTGLEHEDGMKYYEAMTVRKHFLRKLEWHSKKYPENRGQRFLIVDNVGNLYRDTIDKYFYETTGGEIKSMGEKMQKDEAEYHKRLHADGERWKIKSDDDKGRVKKIALFESGQRDTFRVIDSDYKEFFTDILAVKPGIGFNFYATCHVIEYTKEVGKGDNKRKETKEYADGRADGFLSGYFNLILTFNKDVEYKRDNKGRIVDIKVGGFYVDTAVGAKNRLSPDIFFDITGKGAEEFYAELERKRDEEENKFTKGEGTS